MTANLSEEPAGESMARPGDEVPAGTPGSGDDVCPQCNGEKTVDENECPSCLGTGMITRAIGGA
jgi:hypothetical protein